MQIKAEIVHWLYELYLKSTLDKGDVAGLVLIENFDDAATHAHHMNVISNKIGLTDHWVIRENTLGNRVGYWVKLT